MDIVVLRRYRIRQSGTRGCTITLPRGWITDQGLEAGDEVSIAQRPRRPELIITPIKREKA